ncbi:MAG TPA: sugar phosphate nucleotidyltransferase [Acidobacteriaceae bacterium]|nr:sugar phosphate nucleotidyltransferase [Acidobacteriaceae bacterium]
MLDKITPVILCGGSGTRLWPRSRAARPKPFLPLLGDQSLFEEALVRCQGQHFDKPLVVTGAAHVQLVEDALFRAGRDAEVIVEPCPRGTAAAVALAAVRLPDSAILLVCPSDHHIGRRDVFIQASGEAATLAEQGWLVCLGIDPAAAETRFGYIQRGEALDGVGFRVRQFVEKPDKETAETYLTSGDFAWNAGIFCFRAGDYLAELEKYRPDMTAAVRSAAELGQKKDFCFHPSAAIYSAIRAESLDYALMENTDRAATVMAEMAWSDIGDWQTLKRMREQDANGNSVRGSGNVIDCRNVLIDSDGPKVHAIGLDNVIIVVDGDDVLISSTAGSMRIGELGKDADK